MRNIHKIAALLTGVALLTAAVVVVSFRTLSEITEAAEARKHTYTVIGGAHDLLSVLIDAENSQRGYLLTGDESFLAPYLAARDSIGGKAQKLSQITHISSAQQHLDALTQSIGTKLSSLSHGIELQRNNDGTAAIDRVRSDQDRELMNSIRVEMDKFIQIEEASLAKHEEGIHANIRHLLLVITTIIVLTLLTALLVAYLVYRETQYRLKALLHLETEKLLDIQEETNTRLQMANVTLQASDEKLLVTLNSIGDAVMATDAEGHVTLLNPLAERLTGWTQAEAAGHKVDEVFRIINQESRESITIPLNETLVHGAIQGLAENTTLIARDGSECAIADSCAPIRNLDGQVIGAVLVFRDITDRMEIEAGLDKTREELEVIRVSAEQASEFAESVINTVREPLIALDQDLRVVSVGRSFYEVFKVKPEETVGQLIYDLGNKQWNIPKLRELLETILPQETSFDNYEVEHDFTTIGKRTMLLNARQIQRAFGKERIILLAIEDITVRRQVENGLENARKQLEVIKQLEDEAREYAESIINTVREPLIGLDQDLRVVTVSRSFYEVFKVEPEETMGQLIYDLGNKQWNIPKLRELLETILPQETSFDNYEVEHDFATIGRRVMLLNARQIQRASGKERIILLAIEDITVRRDVEDGLQEAHEQLEELTTELQRAARVKAEFLANMSHELRTPLNSINGFSEVLYDETFGTLNEKQKKYVNNVLTSGKHLLLLINQILDMAKVEAGKMNIASAHLPMKNLLKEISLLVEDMVSTKGLEMVLEIPEDLPDIQGDDLKVREILYNLLSNATKFTPAGGRIGMRATQVDGSIEIVVWDTGVGIAPENMERIFEGFFRVDTPYSRVTEGTGLGLPLSKKLVELHGGELSVESGGVNKGTSVRFTLPIEYRKAM